MTVENTGEAAQDPSGTGDSVNPSWQPFLDILPTSLHSQVTPVLKEWDRGVNEKLQSVKSEYEPLEPFKDYDPELLETAITLVGQLQEDPSGFYERMGEALGVSAEKAKEIVADTTGVTDTEDEEVDPRIKALEAQIQELSQGQQNLTQREIKRQEDADLAAIDNALDTLREDHTFDEGYVLTLMAQGVAPDAAVAQFEEIIKQYGGEATPPPARKRPSDNAPPVVGGGGTIPAESIETKKLTASDRQDLIVQMLEAAKNADS